MCYRLHNNHFSIISNNCFGGHIYQSLQLPNYSPFIGLFIFAPCYIKLVKNLETFLSSDLKFVSTSKYHIDCNIKKYPIGVLGDDIELHFLHYENETEALARWTRRVKHVDFDNLFITFSDNDCFTEQILCDFEHLPYKNKICFTAHFFSSISSAIWINERKNSDNVGNLISYPCLYRRHFDIVSWLNNGNGKPNISYKFFNRTFE